MDHDLQRWGDRKLLFLEAAKEIPRNGLTMHLISAAAPGPVVGVGRHAEGSALQGRPERGSFPSQLRGGVKP